MTAKSQTYWTGDVAELLRVGEDFVLSGVDPSSTPGYGSDKKQAAQDLASGIAELDLLKEKLFAQSRVGATNSAVLLVLQGMDSSGKGGIVRHVVGSVDPQGVSLASFGAPTDKERAQDFLWRIQRKLPGAGRIGVFDRSHYEDVLIGRVRDLADADEIERRYGAINDFEREVAASGTRIVKVMLHISYAEQKARLMERLDRPEKHWKFAPSDVEERTRWPYYMAAYQTVFERTSTEHAPWYVVPADRKWYARLAVQHLLLEALEDIDPRWPSAGYDVALERERLAAT